MTQVKKSERLNLSIKVALHSKLVEESEAKGIDVNDVIRNCIVEHYDRQSAGGAV